MTHGMCRGGCLDGRDGVSARRSRGQAGPSIWWSGVWSHCSPFAVNSGGHGGCCDVHTSRLDQEGAAVSQRPCAQLAGMGLGSWCSGGWHGDLHGGRGSG